MASSPDFEYSPDELNELLTAVMPDIPGYRVMRLLGRGGMSFVYLGVQESLDRQVAIKVIRPDALKDEISKLRFEKEARTIAKLQHPCIVGIHEVGRTEQGLFYYVMPYLAKGHLGERKLHGDQPRVIAVLHALLWALDYAHLRGMVHRDVKAENVLFDNADRPVLTDFGIALNKRERSRITGSGFAVGSGEYMAPEQARGEAVDGRADLYALGVLTFELLTGELPYRHDDPLGLALMHAIDPIPRLPGSLQHWQRFIDTAMAKSRDDRFADAQEMMAALEEVETARARAQRAEHAPALWEGGLQRLRTGLTGMAPHWRMASIVGLASVLLIAGAVLLWPRLSATDDAPSSAAAAAPAPAAPSTTASPAVTAADPSTRTTGESAAVESVEGDPALLQATFESAPDEAEEELDPLPEEPGLRELALAERQIAQHRLTQPPGSNALQSLLDAQRLAPATPGLSAAGERWLSTAKPFLDNAIATGQTDSARALYANAKRLAESFSLQSSDAWRALHRSVVSRFEARLKSSLAARDLEALRATKRDAQSMGIAAAALEPLWSQPIVLAKRGDTLARGLPMVLSTLPAEGRAGLAVMPRAVTRNEYAAFAQATDRAEAGCRIRTALMTLKKRSWRDPGFKQGGNHPAVCVSVADASAYASWLSQRDGLTYRLPSATEWQSAANLAGFAEACQAQRIACAGKGTAPTDSGPMTSAAVHAMHGNVREWPAGCGADCRTHAALGASWRDTPTASASDNEVDARYGYDDIGFRLVRDVGREEVEQR